MSFVRQRRLTDKVTVWRSGGYSAADPYAQAYSRVGVFPCNWIEGGSVQQDNDGADFQPRKTIRLQNVTLEFGDYVYIGDIPDATPPNDAEKVRSKKGGGTMLRGGVDLTIYTG